MYQDKQSWNKERAVKIGALGLVLIGALVVIAVALNQESSRTNQLDSKNSVVAPKVVKADGLPATKCPLMLMCNDKCRSACASTGGFVSCYTGCLDSPICAVSCAKKQLAKNDDDLTQLAAKLDAEMQVAADNWTSENSCRDFCYNRFYQMNYNYANYLRCEQMCFNGRYSHWAPRTSSCTTVCYAVSGNGNCHTICNTA